jgi:hypothetical protein
LHRHSGSGPSTSAAPLTPEDAASHIGETATVCGVVASAEYEANERSQPTLLDLGKPYPNAIFTAVIYGHGSGKIPTSLFGKRICVTGSITDFRHSAVRRIKLWVRCERRRSASDGIPRLGFGDTISQVVLLRPFLASMFASIRGKATASGTKGWSR